MKLKRAKEILGSKHQSKTDQEIQEILAFAESFADLTIDYALDLKKKGVAFDKWCEN